MKGGKRVVRTEERMETSQEARQRIKNEKEREQREIYMKKNTERLSCDSCGLSMGRVYTNDLEGSRFYHSECIK